MVRLRLCLVVGTIGSVTRALSDLNNARKAPMAALRPHGGSPVGARRPRCSRTRPPTASNARAKPGVAFALEPDPIGDDVCGAEGAADLYVNAAGLTSRWLTNSCSGKSRGTSSPREIPIDFFCNPTKLVYSIYTDVSGMIRARRVLQPGIGQAWGGSSSGSGDDDLMRFRQNGTRIQNLICRRDVSAIPPTRWAGPPLEGPPKKSHSVPFCPIFADRRVRDFRGNRQIDVACKRMRNSRFEARPKSCHLLPSTAIFRGGRAPRDFAEYTGDSGTAARPRRQDPVASSMAATGINGTESIWDCQGADPIHDSSTLIPTHTRCMRPGVGNRLRRVRRGSMLSNCRIDCSGCSPGPIDRPPSIVARLSAEAWSTHPPLLFLPRRHAT